MIKVFGLIRRREDFTVSAFSTYWRTVHLTEALKLKTFLRRYVQNHFWAQPLPGLKRPADGSPELWFERLEDMTAMAQSDAYLRGAYLDEPRFMEGRSAGVAMTEEVIAPEPVAPTVKAIFLYAPAPGLDLAAFAAAQRDHDAAPLIGTRRAIGRVRSTAVAAPEPPLYAGADEIWWATQAEFEADWDERPEGPAFIDTAGSAGCRVDELRVF